MKRIRLLSDYTSTDEPNYLNIIRDDQGDIHVNVYIGHETERGIRIAASGTRHSRNVREAFYRLVDALELEKGLPKASDSTEPAQAEGR
jgi:hypothetical protein